MAPTPAFTLQSGPDNTVIVKDTTDYSEVNREDFAVLLGLSAHDKSESYQVVADPYAGNEFTVNFSTDGIYRLRLYLVPADVYEEMVANNDIIPANNVSFSEAWDHTVYNSQEKLAKLTLHWLENRTHQALELKLIFERRLESAQLYFHANMYSKSQALFNQLNHG